MTTTQSSVKSPSNSGRSVVFKLPEPAAMPTHERRKQQGGLVRDVYPESPNSRRMVVRYRAKMECKLEYYRVRGDIDGGEYAAGLRFREAWQRKAEGINTCDSINASVRSGKLFDPMQDKTWAERTLHEAYSVLTARQRMIIDAVCGVDEFAGSSARVQTLRRGLDRMARLWKIE